MTTDKIEVAIALLIRDGQFLLQLRDNIPTIVYPGHWAFFGGHIEPGETPEAGVWREIKEEINYVPPRLDLFVRWEHDNIVRHVFYGPLVVPVEQLKLSEGWDLGLWTVADVERGERFSTVANQIRPLGQPHRILLRQFIAQYPQVLEQL
ncbi:MAG: NUDIX hydrolase [Cyanobacteria bacterium P01_C01_bin.120]